MNSENIIFGYIDQLYDELSNILSKDEKLTTSSIITIVISLMQIVENYDNISGPDRKKIVIVVLDKFIDDNIDNEVERRDLKMLMSMTVPTLIDSIVSIDKKEVSIRARKCLEKFCTCM